MKSKIMGIILGIVVLIIILFQTNHKETFISNIDNNVKQEIEEEQIYPKYKIDRYKINDKYEKMRIEQVASEQKYNWQTIYKEIVDSVYQYKPEIYISQNADLMYWTATAIVNNIFVDLAIEDFDVSSDGHVIYIKYAYTTKEEHNEKILEAEKRILDLIENIEKADYNEFEKVLSVYTYWATNIKYDYYTEGIPPIEDVIFYNKGICQNYSRIIAYTLNQMNIEAYNIGGDVIEGAHAWNLVKIYDQYYHMDATFESGGETLGYGLRYFGLSDYEMLENEKRTFDIDYIEMNEKAMSNSLVQLRNAYSYELSNHKLILFDRNKNIIGEIDTVNLK